MTIAADERALTLDVPSSRPNILVVDDDRFVLAYLRRCLQTEFEVSAYTDPEYALEYVRQGGVSAVLSDVSMPRMSGIELLKAVRGYDPDLPVVLITGARTLEDATSAIEYGVFRYIAKPPDAAELRATLQQATQLYRLARMKRQALELSGAAGASDRVGLELSFESALASVWVAFQPIVSVSRRTIFGYEALLRTRDAALPTPVTLLDAAERLGRLRQLGRMVRRYVTKPLENAQQQALLFVNLHPRDLTDPDLVDKDSPLTAIAHRVILEITERSPLGGIDDVQRHVAMLRELGYRIAIDDLGAGYAGLTSFALLEPEIVKIDMSLTRGVHRSPVKQKLVASLSTLCRDMGMTIVVEGVETVEERDTLAGLGCDLLQGHLFAVPGPAFPEPAWEP
ncbi:MAG: EAL domain-containing protein [Myxococcota bacterium]